MSNPPATRPPPGETDAFYLLTYQGTLLCQDSGGALCQQPLKEPLADPVPVPAGIKGRRFEQFLSNDSLDFSIAVTEGALAGFTAASTDGGRTLTFAKEGRFMTAERDQRHITQTRKEAMAWEGFAPIAARDVTLLRGMATNRWVVRSTGAIVALDGVEFGAGFAVKLGGISADIRYQLPFEGRLLPYRIALLREGWRIDEACMLRPLVVMTAFRIPAVHEQVVLSLRSLREVAGYTGQVLLLTDIPADALTARLSGALGTSTTVITLSVSDAVGSAAARYTLLDWPHARHFQPILCVDPDVVFDGDIMPMLAAIAASSRITAPVEPHSLLQSSPEAGASLLQQDGSVSRLAAGFSVAALGIPNLVEHRDTLTQIRRVMVNRSARFGRNEPEWLEQEVANYVCHKLAAVDTHLLSAFFRTVPASQAGLMGGGAGLLRLDAARGSEAMTDAMRAAFHALAGMGAATEPGAMLEDLLEGPAL